jgi:hypothetical protein
MRHEEALRDFARAELAGRGEDSIGIVLEEIKRS